MKRNYVLGALVAIALFAAPFLAQQHYGSWNGMFQAMGLHSSTWGHGQQMHHMNHGWRFR